MRHRISNSRILPALFALSVTLAIGVSWAARARAKELDQFSDRRAILRYYAGGYRTIPGAPGPSHVTAVLDAKLNALLDRLQGQLAELSAPTQPVRDELVRAVFQHRYLPELVTPYEEWVKHEAPVPLYKVHDKGIYGHRINYDDMRMTWYIEASPVLQVAGVLIGLDKLGHFLAQGFAYYEHARDRHADLAAIRRLAHAQELEQLGLATGGVYSFADLAANWQGMLFFRALFDDVEVEGERQSRFFRLDAAGHYQRVREFHWADWVSSDWDEALNPSGIESAALYEKLIENFGRRDAGQPSVCDEYRRDPAGYLGPVKAMVPRERYSLPERTRALRPLDVRVICR